MAINMASRIKKVSRIRDLSSIEAFASTVQAAQTYLRRRQRFEHPAGDFDKAGRFRLREPTVGHVRSPSRAWPYSEMLHGRTLMHCAHVHGADELNVRAIVTLLDGLLDERCWLANDEAAPLVNAALANASSSDSWPPA